MWLLVGAVGFVIRRPAGWRAPTLLTAASLIVILATVLGVYAVPEYSVPVVPSFVLLAAVGWLGERVVTRSVSEAAPTRNVPAP